MGRLLGVFLALGPIVSGCATGETNRIVVAQAQDDQACQVKFSAISGTVFTASTTPSDRFV
jgi:hypothetical protein